MLEELFAEYLLLRAQGLTVEEALKHFSYLHPITMARLRAFVAREED